MDWDDLRTFLAIARHGNLSAAARELGVTQPTMGRRLAAMEQRFGARLLQRFPGKFELTALGEAVLGNVERMEAEAIAADRLIAGKDVGLKGLVRLTTVDSLAARIITPAIAKLQQQHPDIVVEVLPDPRSLSLARREADVAIRMSPFDGQSIIARKIGVMAVALYGTPYWKDRAASGDVRLVTVLDDQQELPEALWLKQAFPNAEISFRSNSREVLLWAAKKGVGVAALARFRADMEADLICLSEDRPDLHRDIWLGVHADMRHMPRIRAVMDVVIQELAENAPLFQPRIARPD